MIYNVYCSIQQVLSMLLLYLEKLAGKVLRREKWNVCVKITSDLKHVHETLFKNLRPLLMNFPAKMEKLKQSYVGMLKIAANAHLHLVILFNKYNIIYIAKHGKHQ